MRFIRLLLSSPGLSAPPVLNLLFYAFQHFLFHHTTHVYTSFIVIIQYPGTLIKIFCQYVISGLALFGNSRQYTAAAIWYRFSAPSHRYVATTSVATGHLHKNSTKSKTAGALIYNVPGRRSGGIRYRSLNGRPKPLERVSFSLSR